MAKEPKEVQVQALYPPVTTPAIYADAVVNVSNSASVTKFYLARTDPSVSSNAEQARIIAQIVMPLPSFINTYVFFEKIVNGLKSQGLLSEEELDQMRASLQVEEKS